MKKYGLIIIILILVIVVAAGSYFAGAYLKSKVTKTVVNSKTSGAVMPTPSVEASPSAEVFSYLHPNANRNSHTDFDANTHSSTIKSSS